MTPGCHASGRNIFEREGRSRVPPPSGPMMNRNDCQLQHRFVKRLGSGEGDCRICGAVEERAGGGEVPARGGTDGDEMLQVDRESNRPEQT
jgi:hypothetical protein